MVKGIEKFREHFKDHEDQYAIIGGTACDLLFEAAGLEFRATKDIDMVICVEVVDVSFAEKIREFLDAGGYEAREKSDGKKEFYRFHKPKDDNFPFMLEIFSRAPGTLTLADDATITKIPVEEDVVSLSAILLEEGYYEAMEVAKLKIKGVTIIDKELLIPFKARAFLDLTGRAAGGEKIDSRDIRKHRSDVFRLVQLLTKDTKVDVSKQIIDDLKSFLVLVQEDNNFNLKDLKIPMKLSDAVELIHSVYGVT